MKMQKSNKHKTIILKKRTDVINSKLLEGEEYTTYPFGEDRFFISHGKDYFAFFQRLGTPYWALTINPEEKIVSRICVILRNVPTLYGKMQKAWYLCDLKKDRLYQSTNTLAVLFRAIFYLIWKCQRGYAISMNKSDGSNPLHLVIKKSVFLPYLRYDTLAIFSCSYEQLLIFLPTIEKYRGSITYLNLQGKKDIILKKTGKLPLLHLQFGPMKSESNTLSSPLPDFTYMWCAPISDPLSTALAKLNCMPSATASIISFRMKKSDWSSILTSDI